MLSRKFGTKGRGGGHFLTFYFQIPIQNLLCLKLAETQSVIPLFYVKIQEANVKLADKRNS